MKKLWSKISNWCNTVELIVETPLTEEERKEKINNIVNYPKPQKIRGFEEVTSEHKKIEGDTTLPVRGSKYSAGYDFFSKEKVIIKPGRQHLFWTDVNAYMMPNEVLEVHVRSSIGIKKGLVMGNSTGIIDCVPAGTMIKTKDGDIEVEKLLEVDKIILSYNLDSKEIEEDELTEIFTVNYDELIQLESEDGDIVEIPETKEVFTERGWIMAKNLIIDDKILKF